MVDTDALGASAVRRGGSSPSSGTKCQSGGIGRRARLKLVYSGVWVRFPPLILIIMEKVKLFLKKMLVAFFETISHH